MTLLKKVSVSADLPNFLAATSSLGFNALKSVNLDKAFPIVSKLIKVIASFRESRTSSQLI